jgi:calreticulin
VCRKCWFPQLIGDSPRSPIGKNYLLNKEIPCESDELSHLYTLIVKPDNSYEVKIDGESKQTGSLKEDWDMIPPKKINDPDASKPEDWVDEQEIDDPEDTKPDDWDDEPETIADPDAEQPEDWYALAMSNVLALGCECKRHLFFCFALV